MNKKTILWLSDGPQLSTGYSTQSLNILNGLADMGHEMHYLQHTSGGLPLKKGARLLDDTEFKFNLHGNGLKPYAEDIMEFKIRELKADVFGVLLDTFMVYPWILQKDFSPAKSIFYYPSDGRGGMPLGCDNVLRKFDYPIAMSKFAQTQVKEKYGLDTGYIPHGINTNIHKPLNQEERDRLRKEWKLEGKFVFGSVFRNQGRKMSDRLLQGFALAANYMPNAILLLHCDPYDPAAYFNMFHMINELKLNNRVIFTGTRYYKGFDYKRMNEVYNLMDVFILSTSGEGFGIPLIDAMASGIPVLGTDYTTTDEIVIQNKAGEGIGISAEIMGSWQVNRGITDIKDTAAQMIKFYNDENLRKEYGKNGRKAAVDIYSWDKIIPQWNNLIKKI